MAADVSGYGYDPTIHKARPVSRPRYVETLPSSHSVPSKFLPPVGQQGTSENEGYPGTCCAWAMTYGSRHFHRGEGGKGRSLTPAGQASPAFIYIQVLNDNHATSGTCGDTSFDSYFKLLAANGTPTMQTAPYVANCTQLWQKYANANLTCDAAFEIGPIRWVKVSDLDSVKQVLA